ncbi:MAG: YceD family protein [Acidimicrobiales bacterium]
MTARTEMLLGVGDLLRRPGSRREVARTVVVDELVVGTAAVADGTEVAVDLVIESTAQPGTITVSGSLTSPWAGECRRCLTAIEGTLETSVHEIFATHPTDEEIWPLEDESIDVGAVVREGVLLALPLAPLCSEECRGPAPEEFPALSGDETVPDDAAEDQDGPPGDPRWAALDQLRFD